MLSRRSTTARVALAILGASSNLPAMAPSRTVSPSSGTSQTPRRRYGRIVPFSSARQDARTSARQYTVVNRAGFEIMQTCRRGESVGEAMDRVKFMHRSVSKTVPDGGIEQLRIDLKRIITPAGGRAA